MTPRPPGPAAPAEPPLPHPRAGTRATLAGGRVEFLGALPEPTGVALLDEPGHTLPALVRFSRLGGSLPGTDLGRGVRGFSVRVSTDTGPWDLPGTSVGAAPLRDPASVAPEIHDALTTAGTAWPGSGWSRDGFWSAVVHAPQAVHHALWTLSPRGLPRSLRFLEGFVTPLYRCADGRLLRMRWSPTLGPQSLLVDEAAIVGAVDPDAHRRDLYAALARGDRPSWALEVQVLHPSALERWASSWGVAAPDPTLAVPDEIAPAHVVARLTLEQGGPDGDELLDLDEQSCPPGLEPWTAPGSPPASATGPKGEESRPPGGEAAYEGRAIAAGDLVPARLFWRSLDPVERHVVIDGLAVELGASAQAGVRTGVLALLHAVDPDLAGQIAGELGVPLPPATPTDAPVADLAPTPSLSTRGARETTFAGRVLGVLLTDGADGRLLDEVRDAFESAGAIVRTIAPTVGDVLLDDRRTVGVDQVLSVSPSALFDAIAVLVSASGAVDLAPRRSAVRFVGDAFAHRKFVGWSRDAHGLLEAAGIADRLDASTPCLEEVGAAGFLATCQPLRHWRRDVQS